ncbi:hypothetical protein [Leifsonia sp. NPDC058248]|uniref:hypothetical protein n=1 Tax=Leifsonia sp. NPDC058248 TaxID=3346402 RepID=UPI0036DC401F
MVTVGALGLFGCANQPHSALGPGEAPSRPWSDLIKSTSDKSTTDAERSALKDGAISDQEYAYFQEQIKDCLTKLGVTAKWSSDKSLEYTKPDGVTNDAIDNCNRENGLEILALRDAMDRNPQQLDENDILVACLKRVKAVDPGYTSSMLASGVDLDKFMNGELFDKCNADPLHYGKNK